MQERKRMKYLHSVMTKKERKKERKRNQFFCFTFQVNRSRTCSVKVLLMGPIQQNSVFVKVQLMFSFINPISTLMAFTGCHQCLWTLTTAISVYFCRNNNNRRAVVVVKWSACSPYTQTIQVRIPLKSTVYIL